MEKVKVYEKENGYRILTNCPFHDDENPSLSVFVSYHGYLYAKCFAGCFIDKEKRLIIAEELLDRLSDSNYYFIIYSLNSYICNNNRTSLSKNKASTQSNNSSLGGNRSEESYTTNEESLMSIEDFCNSRGINIDFATKYGLKLVNIRDYGFPSDSYGIYIPLKSIYGDEYYQIRLLDSNTRFLSKRGSTQRSNIYSISSNNNSIIVLCEGPIKALVLQSALLSLGISSNYSILTVLGVNSVENSILIDQLCKYYKTVNARYLLLAFDCDDPGIRYTNLLKNVLSKKGLQVKTIDHDVLSSTFGITSDKGKCGIDDYIKYLIDNNKLDTSNVLPVKKYSSLVRASSIKPSSPQYLFDPIIPMSSLTIIEGDPGCGKSFLTLGLSLSVSSGSPLYLGSSIISPRESGNVLIFSSEDSSSVISSRLNQLNKCSRCIDCLDRIFIDSEPHMLDDFMSNLESCVVDYNPKLVIIDPIMNYIGSNVDVYKDNSVRQYIGPIVELARKYNFSLVIVRHLKKSSTGVPELYRGVGSIGFAGLARSVLSLSRCEDGSVMLKVVKSSYGNDDTINFLLNYRISEMKVSDIT